MKDQLSFPQNRLFEQPLSHKIRIPILFLMLFVLLAIPTAVSIAGKPITNIGPGYADIRNIAIHPSEPGILYAATDVGIYKSIDAGNSWVNSSNGLTETFAQEMVIALSSPDTLYAITSYKVYKSTNAGADWIDIGKESVAGACTLAVSASDPNLIYLGTCHATLGFGWLGSGVYKSVDGGIHWTPGENIGAVLELAVDPTNSSIVYASACVGREDCRFYKTSNGGDSWSAESIGLPPYRQTDLLIDPSQPQILYAASQTLPLDPPNRQDIFKSTDGGMHWITTSVGITESVSVLAIDPITPTILYAGTPAGVFQTTNAAGTWSFQGNAGVCTPVSTLSVDPLDPSILYAGSSGNFPGNGVCKSNNQGQTWAPHNAGLPNAISYIQRLIFTAQEPSRLYATASLKGIYTTDNDGALWQAAFPVLPTSLEELANIAIDPTNSSVVYLGTTSHGLFKSTNGGTSWDPVNPAWAEAGVYLLEIVPTQPASLYAAVGKELFKTVDGGAHWESLYTDPGQVTAIAFIKLDPTTANTIYLGITGMLATGRSGLMKTTDAGQHWSELAFPVALETGISVQALEIDPQNSQVLYAGTGSSPGLDGNEPDGAVYKSNDGGQSWMPIEQGLPAGTVRSLAIDPTNPARLYAGIGQALYKTVGPGANWFRVNEYRDGGVVFDMAFAPNDAKKLYVGSFRGVYLLENQTYQIFLPVVIR